MPAPKRPNNTAAAEARRRIGDATRAVKLRERSGWIVLAPEDREALLAALGDELVSRQRHGCPHADGGCAECWAAAAVRVIERVATESPHYR